MNHHQLRSLRQRYKAHVIRREHSSTLRPGQMHLAGDILAWLYERDEGSRDYHSRGYLVRPTGTGKTVSLIDFIMGINSGEKTCEMRWDKRVLVLTPTNVLNEQFAAEMGVERFRTPGKNYTFDIPEDKIGVYDATVGDQQKRQAPLDKHIVVMTYDAFVRAVEDDRLNVADFASVLLDEVHTRPRGDNTSKFIRRHVFNEEFDANDNVVKLGDPPTLAIGATATHLYKSGQTIGDYLFGGDEPIHLTQINNAVHEREISGYRNVIVETTYNADARFDGDEELTAADRLAVLKQQARDDAAIRILTHAYDPITKNPYRDMKSVWYCKDIDHAERLAQQINEAMRSSNDALYAKAVSGRMGKKEFHSVIANYKKGGEDATQALTNADILIHGFDDERAELCFMTWPSGSPIEKLQMGGRVLRTHKLKPHATIFDFPDPDKDSPLFGELAGGYHSLPDDYEYPPNRPHEPGEANEWDWPDDISDLNAHYKTRDIEAFAARRKQAQASDKKPDDMLTLSEMATKVGIKPDILEKYVFTPLQGLYDQRNSRTQELDLRDAAQDNVYINGQRFAVGSKTHPGLGYFRTGNNETSFCMNKEAANACRFALFGKMPEPKKYLYNKDSACRLVGITQGKMDALVHAIEEAYHQRNNYQRTITIEGVKFQLNYDVSFCIDRNQPKLFFSSEGLQKLHQAVYEVSAEESQKWWRTHPDRLSEVKSPYWQNKQEVMQELNIHTNQDGFKDFDRLWKDIERRHRAAINKPDAGTVMADGTRLECSFKRTENFPSSTQYELCVDHDAVEWLEAQASTPGRPSRPSGGGNRKSGRGG